MFSSLSRPSSSVLRSVLLNKPRSAPRTSCAAAGSKMNGVGDVQKKDELVQIVDENDVEVCEATRQEMRQKKLLHRLVSRPMRGPMSLMWACACMT